MTSEQESNLSTPIQAPVVDTVTAAGQARLPWYLHDSEDPKSPEITVVRRNDWLDGFRAGAEWASKYPTTA